MPSASKRQGRPRPASANSARVAKVTVRARGVLCGWFDERCASGMRGTVADMKRVTVMSKGDQRRDAICRNDGRGELALSQGDLPALDRATYAAAGGDLDGRGAFRGTLAAAPNNTWSSDPWPAADWTGDGYPDLIEGYPGVLFQNVAGRGFAPRALPERVGRFVSLDADGDGDLDLIFQRSGATIAWYRNDGGGAFSPGSALLVGRVGALLTAADLDGDARQDLVRTDLNGLVVALRGTGNGVFTLLPNAFPGVPETTAAFAADLDGDGDRDDSLSRLEPDRPSCRVRARRRARGCSRRAHQ